MSSPASSAGRKPAGRGGRGRGRGGGGRRGGGGGGRGRSNNYKRAEKSTTATGTSNGGSTESVESIIGAPASMPSMRDEEALIAFMPYLKGDNQEAMSIHEAYQSHNDQQTFLRTAREFLMREQSKASASNNSADISSRPLANQSPIGTLTPPLPPPVESMSSLQQNNPFLDSLSNHSGAAAGSLPSMLRVTPQPEPADEDSSSPLRELERKMLSSLLSNDDDPIFNMPGHSVSAIGGGAIGSSQARMGVFPPSSSAAMQQPFNYQSAFSQNNPTQLPSQTMTPPRHSGGQNSSTSSSPFSSLLLPPTNNNNNNPSANPFYQHQPYPAAPQPPLPPQQQSPAANWGATPPPGMSRPPQTSEQQPSMLRPRSPKQPPTPATPSILQTPVKIKTETPGIAETPKTAVKKEYQPKRLWTRFEEQPGRLFGNNVAPSTGKVVDLRPRQELTAKWMLPLSYLRQRAAGKNINTIRGAIDRLAVGLFRRGCTENGSQASIVSKEVLTPAGESRSDYPFQVINDNLVGTVPFYSPRTPGHVVFRLYWQDDPLHTLATGPTLNVRVTEEDFESSIRFILSNFKAKKVNPTSLSSLNSFALVLEQFNLTAQSAQQPQKAQQQLEGAGRAVWGCICEARKVLDACASEYTKTTAKLEKLEESVDELKAKVEEEETEKGETEEKAEEPQEASLNIAMLREKQKSLMSGRASCERKWRDSQLAFSSILKAVVTNPSISLMLRRELITKMRLEYELWCPLCEEFAVPGETGANMWYEPLQSLPHTITPDHFRICTEARAKMQIRILGFDPNITRLENVLYPNRAGKTRQMNPAAVSVFNQLSAAMGHLYQDVYTTADRIHQQREMIRNQLEKFVNLCEGFPPGTKVVVFGSSANGFGSPKSDLDMCLQLPPGTSVTDEDDPTGANAMAKLAQMFEENGMQDVDTARLTARIPVIKFNCPTPLLENGNEGEEAAMECDLSMHNPLAVLNTSLLRTYAEINPVSRVLAAIIKRWAKARDINNPARHTLSSYGYILMLLHYLTFHQRAGNGLVAPFTGPDGKPLKQPNGSAPLLPNLQWMDETWPDAPPGTPYREFSSQPKKNIKHPLEDKSSVNTYFYRPNGPMQLNNLQRVFPGQDLSLAILLASFFRYYAYDFDYKRHVVSLHSTSSHGLVEREVKAELDGWRNYSAALTIEDPFETFYDVAHVLRGGYYHRIRREFAVAYTKICDVASGKASSTWSNKTLDLASMTGMDLVDWICEPVTNDRDEASPA